MRRRRRGRGYDISVSVQYLFSVLITTSANAWERGRLEQVAGDVELVGPGPVAVLVGRGEHDHSERLQRGIGANLAQELDAVIQTSA